jgi:hypothetical protein
VEVDAPDGRDVGRGPSGEQAADDPGEYVAAARRAEAGRAGEVQVELAAGDQIQAPPG